MDRYDTILIRLRRLTGDIDAALGIKSPPRRGRENTQSLTIGSSYDMNYNVHVPKSLSPIPHEAPSGESFLNGFRVSPSPTNPAIGAPSELMSERLREERAVAQLRLERSKLERDIMQMRISSPRAHLLSTPICRVERHSPRDPSTSECGSGTAILPAIVIASDSCDACFPVSVRISSSFIRIVPHDPTVGTLEIALPAAHFLFPFATWAGSSDDGAFRVGRCARRALIRLGCISFAGVPDECHLRVYVEWRAPKLPGSTLCILQLPTRSQWCELIVAIGRHRRRMKSRGRLLWWLACSLIMTRRQTQFKTVGHGCGQVDALRSSVITVHSR